MDRILEFSGNHPLLVAALVAMVFLVIFHEVRRGTGSGQLSTTDAVRAINRGATVVDVREPEKFQAGHIVNARNLPITSLQEKHATLAKLRKKPVITVCDSGGQAARAAAQLRKLGFEQVSSLGGGLNAWRQENLPLVREDRQGAKAAKKSRENAA